MLAFLKKILVFLRLIEEGENSLSITTIAAYLVLIKIVQAQNVGLTEIGAFLIAMASHQYRANRRSRLQQDSSLGHGVLGIGVADNSPRESIPPTTNQSASSLTNPVPQVGGGGVPVVGPVGGDGSSGVGATTLHSLQEEIEELKSRMAKIQLKALFAPKN